MRQPPGQGARRSVSGEPPPIHIQIAEDAFADLERLEEFLPDAGNPLASQLLPFVLQGIQVLELQPGIGRPVAFGQRELIISRGRGGYLARYLYQRERSLVTILRIRHQREAGYTDDEV